MNLLEIIKRLRIEPFIFLYMFAFAIHGLTITQLAQDKLCLFKYGLSAQYCQAMSDEVISDSGIDYKNQILSDVTTFTLYKTLINSIPVIFWSLFLGAWADRHSRAPKFLMITASIASVFESLLLLLNSYYFELGQTILLLSFIPFSMCGGLLSIMMSIYSYISSTTDPQFRTIRFAILEAIIFVASPLGIYVGGLIIGDEINGPNGQLHRYVDVFALGLITQILASLWIAFIPLERGIFTKGSYNVENDVNRNSYLKMNGSISEPNIGVTEETDDDLRETQPLLKKLGMGSTNEEIKNVERVLNISLAQQTAPQNSVTIESTSQICCETLEEETTEEAIIVVEDVHWYVMFKDLFDTKNVKEMLKTCTKPRADGKRSEIWILIISLTLITLTTNGALGVLFQFVQKVFDWNAEIYSVVNASTLLITSLSVVIIVPVLIKVFKFKDISLSIVGVISAILQNLIRGTILNAGAFYFSYIFGSLSYLPMISVRSKLSTIVDQTEENKVFGVLATFETITPFISSIIYSTLFTATIAIHPGLVFQISTLILLIPFLGFVYIALYCERNLN